jgi:hypothetical protein
MLMCRKSQDTATNPPGHVVWQEAGEHADLTPVSGMNAVLDLLGEITSKMS